MNEQQVTGLILDSLQVLYSEGLIGPAKAAQIKKRLTVTKIQILSQFSEEKAACIIHCPQLIRGEPVSCFSIRVACRERESYERYIALHEISHFLSIGEMEQISGGWYERKWGICKTFYRLKKGIFTEKHVNDCCTENEMINECLAAFLYSRLYRQNPDERMLKRAGRYAFQDQRRLLSDYLSNRAV